MATKPCETCGGSGQVTCPECNGSGSAIDQNGKRAACITKVTCTTCGGTGRVTSD